MARFLSAAWFDEIESARPAGRAGGDGNLGPTGSLVMEQIVTGTPDGDVGYLVVVEGGGARVERRSSGNTRTEADLTITCDWSTATAISQGRLSTQRALMQGRLRVRGNPADLLRQSERLAGLDPIPAAIRKNTTY